MFLITDGFAVGAQVLPWGTTLGKALLQLPGVMAADGHSAKFQSAPALGLAGILSVTLYAPALDRPILQAWYHLSYASENDLLEDVTRTFGPPAQQTDYDISPAYINPSFAVRRALHWQAAGFDVGLSIYGAPREIPEGLSVAAFYVTWDDELAAAAPYLAVMTEFEAWLEVCATRAEVIWQGMLDENRGRYSLASPLPMDSALLRAGRCLRRRLLYQTPATLARTIQLNQVLVWKDVVDSIWCVSTRSETVCFQTGQLVNITCLKLLPAKGRGATFLTISDLTLESVPDSSILAQLSTFLCDEMGAQLSFTEDYDI